jgi:DNA-binding NtrC family response regulator
VRQLSNVLERAKILADPPQIRVRDLPSELAHQQPSPAAMALPKPGDDLASVERAHVMEVLQREGGNKARAARRLGINRRSLYRLLEKYEIKVR